MALHGSIQVNGASLGWWTATRIITRSSGNHTYRWEAAIKGIWRTGDLRHDYGDGAAVLASKVLAAFHTEGN